jgi:hypothetical protein
MPAKGGLQSIWLIASFVLIQLALDDQRKMQGNSDDLTWTYLDWSKQAKDPLLMFSRRYGGPALSLVQMTR